MDECEALCNRLTIMVDGVMKCIGNIQYLKNRYEQGYTVMIKLLNVESVDLASIKFDIERQFTPGILLKDEHKVSSRNFISIFVNLVLLKNRISYRLLEPSNW